MERILQKIEKGDTFIIIKRTTNYYKNLKLCAMKEIIPNPIYYYYTTRALLAEKSYINPIPNSIRSIPRVIDTMNPHNKYYY